ncbi:ATP-grasp domain-containing protein [Alkalibacillus haloalkaliphilus]|uniref:ATP-grasp domain-containing protein n=1 Tax=Alkalibacillus haloalkaliphilus TaxID=94136 RepID=A0A511VZK9_9BACI|nr:ATP-grasp domain-containing protein [Alkalibacillus haloalkaliphilus]GEN44226.1 hypothetical protein AHA02nite_00020 [Alkalibacillus haloalkaliphilus]
MNLDKVERYDWLPHLETSIPEFAFGDKIDMYVMALEGWRRGLTLRFVGIGEKSLVRFKLSDGKKEHSFSVTRGDLVSKEAVNICVNKDLTKQYLEGAEVPVPKGYKYSKETPLENILTDLSELNFPFVVKPIDGRRGKGVISNIQNEQQLIDSIKYLREDLLCDEFIVEEHFNGEEYRVYIVGNDVVGVIKREPANIMGDGHSTIRELIRMKNERRKKVPNLYARLIKVDKETEGILKEKNYNLETILKKDEKLLLSHKANLSTGGDSIDYTDELPSSVKEIAIKGLKCVPNMPHGGVDILYNEETGKATIIEINSRAGVGGHLFPLEGKARDIPKAIMDFYFPNTVEFKRNEKLHFDLEQYWNLIKGGKAKEIVVPNVNIKKNKTQKFIIETESKTPDFRKFINQVILKRYSNVSITIFGQTKIEIVLNGEQEVLGGLKVSIHDFFSRKKVEYNMSEKEYPNSILQGVNVRHVAKRNNLRKQINENEKLRKEINNLQDLLKEKSNEVEKLQTSKSWRYTKPMRAVMGWKHKRN